MKDFEFEGYELKLTDDLGIIGLPYTLLKELNWNTFDKIIIVEYDKVHRTLTIGKKLSGQEAVESMKKITEEFK